MVELLKNTFRLDIEDKAALSHEFDAVAALCARVPAFRLDFPRRFAELAAVRAAVEATVEESPRRS